MSEMRKKADLGQRKRGEERGGEEGRGMEERGGEGRREEKKRKKERKSLYSTENSAELFHSREQSE